MGTGILNIAVIEPSHIIYEGLSHILLKADCHLNIFRFKDFDEVHSNTTNIEYDIVIMNPAQILNRLPDFVKAKKKAPATHWLALVYAFFDAQMMTHFDGVFHINDMPTNIAKSIQSFLASEPAQLAEDEQEQLSDREKDVLILITKGLLNKEIADKLNISIHTVISHRKNISTKTGIKSQSGLTIYALTKKLISIEDNM